MKKINSMIAFVSAGLFLCAPGIVQASPKEKAAEPVPAVIHEPAPVAATVDVVQKLKDGNARFVEGRSVHANEDLARRQETLKGGQHPFVSVLTCSDSRVPPEEIFDAYGAGHLGIPVIVVMGHTKCGAVTAVMKGDKVGGNIAPLVARIVPSAKKVKDAKKGEISDDTIDMAMRENVWQTMADIISKSKEIQGLVSEGKLKVIGAVYDITTGKVEWLGEHPKQVQLLGAEGALAALKKGNARFVAGTLAHPHLDADRRQSVARGGQAPFASILSCADSRVPLENVFDAGVGDLFTVRVAGNVAGASELGTLEYGAGHLGTPLVVVMGHTKCGAVTAVVQGGHASGNIAPLVAKIVPAAKKVKAAKASAGEDELIDATIRENVWQAIADMFSKSEEIKELVINKKIKVVGALYDIGTGSVEWLGEHPKQKDLTAQHEAVAASDGVSKSVESSSAKSGH